VNTTGWLKGLQVTGDGTGIVSHEGVALLRALSDRTGLTAGLSKALASPRLLIHDRGRGIADLACAITDGAEVISDFRVLAGQEELFGLVASARRRGGRWMRSPRAGRGRWCGSPPRSTLPGAAPGLRPGPATAPCPGCGSP
jgi:hypothetical protein